MKTHEKIPLAGFNNLTRNLSLNIYDVCCLDPVRYGAQYLQYMDEQYGVERLAVLLRTAADVIGARVLHVSSAAYQPRGASVTMLVAETGDQAGAGTSACTGAGAAAAAGDEARPVTPGGVGAHTLLCHLDKSHITVHTYPEQEPLPEISTLRIDIDVSSCGAISPLKVLNYLLRSFQPDVATMDYRVRGFTRDVQGGKCFGDTRMDSIQDFIAADIVHRYHFSDVNMPLDNTFHSRMMRAHFSLHDYLFEGDADRLGRAQWARLQARLQDELRELYQQG